MLTFVTPLKKSRQVDEDDDVGGGNVNLFCLLPVGT